MLFGYANSTISTARIINHTFELIVVKSVN